MNIGHIFTHSPAQRSLRANPQPVSDGDFNDSVEWFQKGLEQEQLLLVKHDHRVRQRCQGDHNHGRLRDKLEDFAQSRGVDINRIPAALEGQTLNRDSLSSVEEQIAGIVPRLLHDKNDQDDVNNFVKRYSKNLCIAYAERNEGREMPCDQAYKLLLSNVTKLALQEQAATETMMSHHGIEHIVSHNMEIAQRLFALLQSEEMAVSAVDRLLIDQVMIDHDIGYALVADEVRKDGIRGQTKAHPVLGAKLAREARNHSPLDDIFEGSDWEAYHQAILFHGRPETNETYSQMVDGPNDQRRVNNLALAVRLADTSHGIDETKLPPLVLEHPRSLLSLRLMQTAEQLGRPDITEEIRDGLRQEIQGRTDFSELKREALGHAIGQTNGEVMKFLVGRFEGVRGQTESLKDGQLRFSTTPNPSAEQIHEFFGFPLEGSQVDKVVQEMGVVTDDFLVYEFAAPPVGWVDESVAQTPFLATVKELIEQEWVQAFHIQDRALAKVGDQAGRLRNLTRFMDDGRLAQG